MKDFYLNRVNVISRLLREYDLHKKLIVAVDFDDTIYDFHKKGHSYQNVIDLLHECKKVGFIIIIFTDLYKDKREVIDFYTRDIGLAYDYINETPGFIPFGHEGKPYYNILLDDRAGLNEAYDTLRYIVNQVRK